MYKSPSSKNLTSYLAYLKKPIFLGTVLLTLSGIVTKFIGFFYRIFLSHIISAEGLGIIGLVSPVIMLAHSIYASGLQNAITRFVAATKNKAQKDAFSFLFTGICISLLFSVMLAYFIFNNAHFISNTLINEPRCTPLLQIVALSFPPAAIHSCINGFFYGHKKTLVPASSMLIEQITRVVTVYLLYKAVSSIGANVSLSFVCIGSLLGEFASAFFSCIMLTTKSKNVHYHARHLVSFSRGISLLGLAIPLSINRICISVISTIETIKLPEKLIASGLSSTEALSIYGIFSGMSMPLIMFPSALTGAASSMLLPSVSEAQSNGNKRRIKKLIYTTFLACFSLGILCMFLLLIFSDFISTFLFHNPNVAAQLRSLAFICPFLYLSGALSSILHGLGKTGITFIFNLSAILLRLFFVLFVVPHTGFSGYIYGMLVSQIFFDLLIILALRHYLIYN